MTNKKGSSNMRIVLLGGGGHASDVLGIVEALAAAGQAVTVAGILADEEIEPARFAHRGVTRIGGIDDLAGVDASHYVAAIGYPAGRRRVVERLGETSKRAACLIHPSAIVAPDIQMALGAMIFAGACVSAGVRLGAHAHVSNAAIVGHDSRVDAFSTVMPGAAVSGDIRIGEGCLIGTNATILQGLGIGDGATVGAGAVVTREVPAGVTAKGNPARW